MPPPSDPDAPARREVRRARIGVQTVALFQSEIAAPPTLNAAPSTNADADVDERARDPTRSEATNAFRERAPRRCFARES